MTVIVLSQILQCAAFVNAPPITVILAIRTDELAPCVRQICRGQVISTAALLAHTVLLEIALLYFWTYVGTVTLTCFSVQRWTNFSTMFFIFPQVPVIRITIRCAFSLERIPSFTHDWYVPPSYILRLVTANAEVTNAKSTVFAVLTHLVAIQVQPLLRRVVERESLTRRVVLHY